MFHLQGAWRQALVLICALFASLGAVAATATAEQVAEAIRNSPNATPYMRQHADEIGALAIFESGGDTTVYNGSCCYGILQMNRDNIAHYAKVPPEVFRNWPLQDQINAWSQLTADGLRASAPQQLIAAGTFDGRPVDFAMIMACVQLGIGNCQTMINSGHCGGFRDRNGTSICDMADRINAGMGNPTPGPAPNPNPSPTPGPSNPIRYGPIDCVTSAGGCMSMSEALRSGFESGSGISMQALRTLIQLLLVATALFVIGRAMIDLWRSYTKGGLATADLTHYMLKSLIIVLTAALVLTVT